MILGGTSSYIRVEFDGKVVKIGGELLANGFLAYKDTIKKWEPPHENEVISGEKIEQIVEHVLEESNKANFRIEFE